MKIALGLTAGLALAQAPPTFRTGTKLVQVSVIAQDKDGNPVENLRREDFQIFDNGAPREIRLFIAEKPAPPEPKVPGTFTNSSHSGYSVLLFENNTTAFEHTAYGRIMALKAFEEIPQGDKIAIYGLWCRFQVVREFTADRESLLRELKTFAPAAAPCASGDTDPNAGTMLAGNDAKFDQFTQKSPQAQEFGRQAAASRAKAAAESVRIAALASGSASDQEIKHLADHLAAIPGRKNLIWLADQYQLSPAGLQRLIDAGVSIYPGSAIGSTVALAADKYAQGVPLRALAVMTGGVATFDDDDLDVFIRKALVDGRISYTLGFYESGEPSSDDKKPAVHQIAVKAANPAIALRYRTSYSVEAPQPAPASPAADLVAAMDSPADAAAIGITATATRTGDLLDLKATINLADLDLSLSEGLWKGEVEFDLRFLTAHGVQVGEVLPQTASIKLSQTPYEAMLKSGFVYSKELTIPPKAVELKLLVGNLASGKIGTLTIPLPEVTER